MPEPITMDGLAAMAAEQAANPVIVAIEEQRYQLGLRREKHQIELDGIEAELEALAQAEKLVLASVDTDDEDAGGDDQELSPEPAAEDDPPTSSPPPAQPPPTERTRVDVSAAVAAVAVVGGKVSNAQVREQLPGASSSRVTMALQSAVVQGRLEKEGQNRWTRYWVSEAERRERGSLGQALSGPPGEGGNAPPVSDETQEPTLEGRILSYCQVPHTAAEISLEIGVPLNQLRNTIGSLMRETHLRTRREEGDTYYVTVQ